MRNVLLLILLCPLLTVQLSLFAVVYWLTEESFYITVSTILVMSQSF